MLLAATVLEYWYRYSNCVSKCIVYKPSQIPQRWGKCAQIPPDLSSAVFVINSTQQCFTLRPLIASDHHDPLDYIIKRNK